MKSIYTFFFISLIVVNNNYAKAQPVNIKDSLALVDLYNNTGGKNWINNTNWLKGPVVTWYGITVNKLRVSKIDLSRNNLKNGLPVSIGNLTALTYLDVDEDALSDTLPNAICDLTALTYFDASNNRITGNIPANIGNLINLNYLNFYFNKLTGSIPLSIVSLTNLSTLNFFANKLTGTIPSTIGNLSKLTWLDLSNNSLEGNLPPSIGNLTNLFELNAFGNNLSGEIPTSITHLKNLSQLDLTSNKFTGSIPDSIGNLTNLYYLSLSGNKLEREIPVSIGNLENLYELHLSGDNLSGSIPESICNLYNLFYLELEYNQLSGRIPKNIGNLFNLGDAKLNNNKLTGNVPASTRNFESLDFLDLSYNDLSGEFIFPSHNLIPCTIYLSHNHFTERKNVMPDKFFDLLGYTLAIDNNNYTFDGIEFLSKQYVQSYYSPQAHITIHQNMDTLSIYAGGTLKNNTYKWFKVDSKDSVVITGDSVFHPSESGSYFARITNVYAKQLTLFTDTINFIKASINNESTVGFQGINIEIFPNPVTSLLNIKGLDVNSKYKIQIVNEKGNVYIEKSIQNINQFTLNTQGLQAGIYYLNILSDNNEITRRKILKN